ncbi:DUF2461 family protein [Nocardioides hungaricus]
MRSRPLRTFRPNRDVRFSKDKSPYRLWIGAVSETRGRRHRLLHRGLRHPPRHRLRCDAHGPRPARTVPRRDDRRAQRPGVHRTRPLHSTPPVTCGIEPPSKTTPRGYPADHPRAEYLRWKGAAIVQEYDKADWMHTPEARHRIGDTWHGAAELKAWLDSHVGASDTPAR